MRGNTHVHTPAPLPACLPACVSVWVKDKLRGGWQQVKKEFLEAALAFTDVFRSAQLS